MNKIKAYVEPFAEGEERSFETAAIEVMTSIVAPEFLGLPKIESIASDEIGTTGTPEGDAANALIEAKVRKDRLEKVLSGYTKKAHEVHRRLVSAKNTALAGFEKYIADLSALILGHNRAIEAERRRKQAEELEARKAEAQRRIDEFEALCASPEVVAAAKVIEGEKTAALTNLAGFPKLQLGALNEMSNEMPSLFGVDPARYVAYRNILDGFKVSPSKAEIVIEPEYIPPVVPVQPVKTDFGTVKTEWEWVVTGFDLPLILKNVMRGDLPMEILEVSKSVAKSVLALKKEKAAMLGIYGSQIEKLSSRKKGQK